jgi:hypothetical protein
MPELSVSCSACATPIPPPELVHCTTCGAHLHRGCAPRLATDGRQDQLVRLYLAGLSRSMLRAHPNGGEATLIATAALLGAVLSGPSSGGDPVLTKIESARFADEAARRDYSYEAFATEMNLLVLLTSRPPDPETKSEPMMQLGGIAVPVRVLEEYLGPRDEWIRSPIDQVPARFRARGWNVKETDAVGKTARAMLDGTLERLPEGGAT